MPRSHSGREAKRRRKPGDEVSSEDNFAKPRGDASDSSGRNRGLKADRPDRLACRKKLRLITQTLLVAVFFHPLAAFVFRDFCFSSFFQRAHREDFNLPISEYRFSA